MFLKAFTIQRPNFEASQKSILDWIIKAHVEARSTLENWQTDHRDRASFIEKIKTDLHKLGLGEEKIQKRGFQIDDCNHENWDEMEIYNIRFKPEGYHLDKRMAFFNRSASQIFETFYPKGSYLPSHLIHVTCTGYVAPSPAQQIVSLRGATSTMVTHAYHMGCYGAIPSIRMAMGHYSLHSGASDIVHTELCSLHMNPTLHSIEQLVVQSLFGDGFIKYTLGKPEGNEPALAILSIHEEHLENTTDKMTWNCNPWGFEMTISKEIPVLLRRHLEGYLERLAKKAGGFDLKKARFAIHPGGPKIIQQIAEKLQLEPWQYQHSVDVLKNYGNMSSATLPHVWDRMLRDPEVKSGEQIISLTFGPGLSCCGGIFEKVG